MNASRRVKLHQLDKDVRLVASNACSRLFAERKSSDSSRLAWKSAILANGDLLHVDSLTGMSLHLQCICPAAGTQQTRLNQRLIETTSTTC